jgi:uncharacterized membrane protein YecN with MAPEG domain
MMQVPVTGLYAALLALVAIALVAGVGATRGKTKISLGDGGDPKLIVAIRRHMNFVEGVPLALLLMALVELNGGSKALLHALGAILLVARLIHPFGLELQDMGKWQRIAGATATLLVTLAAAIVLLWQQLG